MPLSGRLADGCCIAVGCMEAPFALFSRSTLMACQSACAAHRCLVRAFLRSNTVFLGYSSFLGIGSASIGALNVLIWFLGTLQCALVSGHLFAWQAHAQRPFALCVAGASSVTLSSCLLSSGNATGADVGLLRLVANISMTLESLVEGPLIPSPWGITPALGIEGNESSYYRKRAC